MFGKLMKYEMMSSARVFGICYIALMAVSFVLTIPMAFNGASLFSHQGEGIFFMIMMLLYFGIVVAICVLTLMCIIQRFYKNLLLSEGYLMQTLPVPTWQLVLSKLLGASIWTVLSGVVLMVSFMIIGIGMVGVGNLGEIFSELPALIAKFMSEYGKEFAAIATPMFFCFVFSIVSSILQIYFSIMIGFQANKHRILFSVIAFFVITILYSIVDGVAMNAFFSSPSYDYINGFDMSKGMLWFAAVEGAVLSVIFFFGTDFLMKNKLNIE